MYNSIKPGKIWLDTDGKSIQAHGGCVMYIDGRFYWYGENKENIISEYELWHWGVRLYSSKDLYNWKDEGIIMLAEPNKPNHPLHPKSMMDRPHILYNEKTKKFVLWMKIMEDGFTQHMTVATSDSIKGPFEIVVEKLFPKGMSSGDFDLVKFEDGHAVIVFERVHSDMIVMDLTEDYLNVTNHYTVHYERPCVPHVREAPAVFYRKGKGYVITSGTTGKMPNPSEVASFEDIHGEWEVLGEPHVHDIKKTSFDSQISCVFKHPEYDDLYIAMADRWLLDLTEDSPSGVELFAAWHDEKYLMSPERRKELKRLKMKDISKKNTSESTYIWLPIKFEKGIPRIFWYDEWKIEEICKKESE